MNILESFEELINRTKSWFDENERIAEEQIERIQTQIEEHRTNIEKQIEEIESQQRHDTESAEEQIVKLNEELESHQKDLEELMEKMQVESEDKERNIQEQIEKIESDMERRHEFYEERIERIREQFQHKEETANDQIDKIREQIDEFREKADVHVESINDQVQIHKENLENENQTFHSENIHVTSKVSSEETMNQNPVESLATLYDKQYNDRHQNTSISNSYMVNGVEILKYGGKLISLEEMDTTFPRNEWLHDLLQQGVTIKDIDEYCHYLNARDMLIRIQDKPHVWKSGILDITPTDKWETYKEEYIKWLAEKK
ncbi:hypothetical protein JT359_08985 [Candidatus Poribacteria bacterium]|nr:hypothetical protein [Candidatus Poribacteria bacterium]